MSHTDQHLYLTGYRGSGKTSVGKWLGEKLSRPVIDLDDRIEAAAGCSIREIFASEGELGFRDRETAALAMVADEAPSVISLGGGTILRAENRLVIATTGYCVWLQADADTVLQRLINDTATSARRPALTSLPPRAEVESLLLAREPLYRLASNAVIDVVGKRVASIGQEILRLGNFQLRTP